MSELVFRPTQRRRRRGVINLTSLIDVLFLLLIFFMLTSTFRRSGELELDLPESRTSNPTLAGDQPQTAELVLKADGVVSLDGEELQPDRLAERLRARVIESPGTRVSLNAEASARHADVVKLIDLVREIGFEGLSLGTEIAPGTPAATTPSGDANERGADGGEGGER